MLTELVVALNGLANVAGRIVLAPLAWVPGWLSATLVAVGTGAAMLLAFKHTSNQAAILRVRNRLKADLLTLALFKENIAACLWAQGRILLGACRLLMLAVVPMLVMLVPMCLALAQLALWYQARPLRIGEEAVITVALREAGGGPMPTVQLLPNPAVEVTVGPVRAESQHLVCWNVKAREAGRQTLEFLLGEERFEKRFCAGNGFMRLCPARPEYHWLKALEAPDEPPFPPEAAVKSIEIDYPSRDSWIYGKDWWVAYWFVMSMIAAFCLRSTFGVNL
jgi:hypothetical protein